MYFEGWLLLDVLGVLLKKKKNCFLDTKFRESNDQKIQLFLIIRESGTLEETEKF